MVCVKVYILNLEDFNFRYNISFIDPRLWGFGEILPSVMPVFPPGLNIITSIQRRKGKGTPKPNEKSWRKQFTTRKNSEEVESEGESDTS
jgi:hypothetical protein